MAFFPRYFDARTTWGVAKVAERLLPPVKLPGCSARIHLRGEAELDAARPEKRGQFVGPPSAIGANIDENYRPPIQPLAGRPPTAHMFRNRRNDFITILRCGAFQTNHVSAVHRRTAKLRFGQNSNPIAADDDMDRTANRNVAGTTLLIILSKAM
jgi:hypothetical protein